MANKIKASAARIIVNHLRKKFPHFPPEHPPIAMRKDRYSIWARVVSDRFKGKGLSKRWDMITPIIYELPREVYDDLMVLILLTPAELEDSMISREFERKKTKKKRKKSSAA